MGGENVNERVPVYKQLRRGLKKLRALPLSEQIERLIRIGVIKEPRAAEARKRVAAIEAARAAAAGPPPAP